MRNIHHAERKTSNRLSCLLAVLVVFALAPALASAQGTAFTYQGRLYDGTNPANGAYDVQFTLFSASLGGAAAAGPVTNSAVWVTNGLFQTAVDFGGGVFNGANYWLELAVRTNGGNVVVTLAPRQNLTPVPYALYAATAGSVAADGIIGTIPLAQLPASVVTNTASGTIPVSELPASPTSSGSLATNQFNYLAEQLDAPAGLIPPIIFCTWGQWGSTFNSNDFLALMPQTPNSVWNYYHCRFLLNYTAGGFVLQIDDGLLSWRNAQGVLQVDTNKFPWTLAQMVQIAHANGLKLGVYAEPNATGVGRSSAGFPDSEGTNIEFDAMCLATSGVDFVKLDPHGCSSLLEAVGYDQRFENTFRQYATNRSVCFQADLNTFHSSYGGSYADAGSALPGTLIRVFPEFVGWSDTNAAWVNYLTNQIDTCVNLQNLQHPGQWFTADEVNNVYAQPGQYAFGYQSAFTTAINGSPFIIYWFFNVTPAQINLVTNQEILDIAYDPAWQVGQPIPGLGGSNSFEVLVKDMADNSKAVCLLVRSTNTAQTISFSWPELGWPAGRSVIVRDAFGQTNYPGLYTQGFTNTLGPEGCQLLRLYPVDSPELEYVQSVATGSANPVNSGGSAAIPAVASGTMGGTISSNSFGFLNTLQYGGYATVPPICYNTWDTSYGGYNSNAFAADLRFLQQSTPILLNYNQQGFALSIDDGLFSWRTNGGLQINPANFPWTASQLTYIAHTNGVKILCYMEPNGPGAGGRTSAGFPDSEGTNIEWDAQQFALAGFDGLKLDPHGWSTEAELILAVQRAESAFRFYASNRSCVFLHDETFYGGRFPGVGNPNISQIANAYPGTIVRLSSEFSDQGNADFGWDFYCSYYLDQMPGLQALNKPGQWLIPVETATDDSSGNQDTPPVQRLIELSSAEFGSPVLFDQLNGVSAASLAMMTNTEILDVAYDPLWIIGQPVPNVGGSNTFEVFVKTLSDPFGGKELFLLNRNTSTAQTVAFTWPDIGFAVSRQILVRDTQAQTNFGVYSNAFSLNIPPLQCYLLRFEPLDNPWLNYLVTGATAAKPPASLSLSNAVTTVTAGTNLVVTVTLNTDGSKNLRLDGLSTTGLQLLLQTVATLTNSLVLPPSASCPLVIAKGASGLWNSNGAATWLRTSAPGTTKVTDHLLFVH